MHDGSLATLARRRRSLRCRRNRHARGPVRAAGDGRNNPNKSPLVRCIDPEIRAGEDIFAYIDPGPRRLRPAFYKAIIGAANEYKEGDEALGIHALDQSTRGHARTLLGNTKIATCGPTRSTRTPCST
jgi:hypothetical protein